MKKESILFYWTAEVIRQCSVPSRSSPASDDAAYWIAGFTAVHIVTAAIFMARLRWIARAGIIAGRVLILYANSVILKERTPDAAIKNNSRIGWGNFKKLLISGKNSDAQRAKRLEA